MFDFFFFKFSLGFSFVFFTFGFLGNKMGDKLDRFVISSGPSKGLLGGGGGVVWGAPNALLKF